MFNKPKHLEIQINKIKYHATLKTQHRGKKV